MATLERGWMLVCAALLGSACMNDYDEFGFQGGGGAATGGSAGVDAGSGGSAGGAAGSGGGSAGSGGSSGEAGSGGSSGEAGSGGSSGEAGSAGASGGAAGAAGSAGMAGSAGVAGSSGGGPSVICGETTCALATHACCVTQSASSCIVSNANCAQGARIACDGPEDCTGQVCCAELAGGGSSYAAFTCRNGNDCTQQQNRRVVCGGTPNACSNPTKCKPSTILPQYKLCD
jgi:hypothetical protein